MLVKLEHFLGPKIYKWSLILIGIIAFTSFIHFYVAQLAYNTALIVLSSIVIWRAGDHFAPAAEFIEDHHNLPQSVKAAVIDAIASSFPEFAVAVIAVMFLGQFDVGVATIAGSALYNVLVIPAAAGLVAATPLVVNKEVVWRDSLFYLFVVVVLFLTISMTTEWSIGVAIIFFLIYVGYIVLLHRHYKSHQEETANQVAEEEDDAEDMHIETEKQAWVWIVAMMLLMGGASHVLVTASIDLGNLLGIDPVIMGFIVIAAGTSAPDTALSVLSAQRGNYDAAISNVFGSNIFDICICLSVPIAMMFFAGEAYTFMELEHTSLMWILLGSTLLSTYFFYSNKYTLTKPKSALMLALYGAIVLYSITL